MKELYRYYSKTFRPRDRRYGPGDERALEGYLAHDDAIEMILTKIARIATGEYHADNYDDIFGYGKIAHDLHPRPNKA